MPTSQAGSEIEENKLFALFDDEDSPLAISDFVEVSETMMNGYAQFAQQGLPGKMVAFAMLGATINLYRLFGIHDELPTILRGMANRIESGEETN